MDFNIRLCGEAGQGLQSIGKILLSSLAAEGWHIFAHQDYESRIRGGANYFQIRIGSNPLSSFRPQVDLLVAMTDDSYELFSQDLAEDGLAVFPGKTQPRKEGHVAVNLEKLAQEAAGNKKLTSAVVAGLVWALVSDDPTPLAERLAGFFANRGEEIVQANRAAARAGFELARGKGFQRRVSPPGCCEPRMLLRGNDAVALGAINAGVNVLSAYPMTPSTSITEYIAAESAQLGIRVEQAEDEIAAINMAIGAAYTGARAMTTTSGGGFCLMTEAIGLAGSAEIPVVIVNGQRPGPSTGLPTRTEQGDLAFAAHAGHGDFPLAVLAPGSVEEAFYMTGEAFNIADKYQVPVIVLTDQHLADCFQTIAPLDSSRIAIERGEYGADSPEYKRYQLTDSGISPRVNPGAEQAVVVAAGDEHDEEGHLIEAGEMRISMMNKRMNKQELMRHRALKPEVLHKGEGINLITWGSSRGALLQAVEELKGTGHVRAIYLPQLAPLPVTEILELLNPDQPTFTVESNYSGQLARLLRAEGIRVSDTIRRYDGKPLESAEIVQYVQEVINNG